MTRLILGVLVCLLAGFGLTGAAKSNSDQESKGAGLRLGNFSVSLTVKNLEASRAFYEKLGFKMVAGIPAKNWVVLQNGECRIGLFQAMFPKNLLTFNPGWDGAAKPLADFDDVREIQKQLKAKGVTLTTEADAASTGPASLMLVDPDGNPILIDQHVPKPK